MKRHLAFIGLIGLFSAGPALGQQGAAGDPEQAARDFLYNLYANDAGAVQRSILPGEDSGVLIGPQTFTQAELGKLKTYVSRLPLHVGAPPLLDGKPLQRSSAPFPAGTKITYLTQFRGVNFVIPLQRTEDGWKVDVRFWLAMRKQRDVQKTDPEIAAKSFLCHLLANKPDALNQFASQRIDGEEYTAANNLPLGDLDQILSLCVEMPVVRARAGERVVLPSGDIVVADGDADSLVMIGLMGSVEVPFLLKRVDDAWKVVPQKYFEMLRQAGAI